MKRTLALLVALAALGGPRAFAESSPNPPGTPDQLAQVQSTPGTRQVRIIFTLSRASHATVRIYDSGGRLVRTIFDGDARPGETVVTWNADGSKGGIYFYQVEAGGFRSAKKIILVD